MENINILMAGDYRVYVGMELCIYSTLTHTKGINWYILTMEIDASQYDQYNQPIVVHYPSLSPSQRNKLRKIVQYLDPTSNITFIDAIDWYEKEFRGGPNECHLLTPYAPLRLLSDLVFPDLDHILYMDCDVAVMKDIRPMYYEYTALNVDYCAYSAEFKDRIETEMISGVMILNLNHIRESGFLEKARAFFMKQFHKWCDQDAIALAGDPYPMPVIYSYIYEYEKRNIDPTIIHFTNELSPKIYFEGEREYFFRKFPFLQYVDDGLKLLDDINFNCGYSVEEEPPLEKSLPPKNEEEVNNEEICGEQQSPEASEDK